MRTEIRTHEEREAMKGIVIVTVLEIIAFLIFYVINI